MSPAPAGARGLGRFAVDRSRGFRLIWRNLAAAKPGRLPLQPSHSRRGCAGWPAARPENGHQPARPSAKRIRCALPRGRPPTRPGISRHVAGKPRRPTARADFTSARIYQTMQAPALIHCKSGADRAGLAAGLFCCSKGDRGRRAAPAVLRFGHIRQARTGILDAFFLTYQAGRRRPQAVHGLGARGLRRGRPPAGFPRQRPGQLHQRLGAGARIAGQTRQARRR